MWSHRVGAWLHVRAAQLSVALLVAVLASGLTFSSSYAATTAPKTGGELKVALDSDPVCLDPVQSGLVSSHEISGNFVNTLLVQNPTTLKVEPGLAKSYKENSAATSYSFVLREGITFSNGQPLNAQAIKTFFDDVNALGAKAPNPAGYLVGYESTVVTGDYTFTINFKQGNSAFPIFLTSASLGILAPATMSASLSDRCAGKDLYGTGPFVLKSYQPNVSVVLTRRKDFSWGAAMGSTAASGHTGPAYVNSIKFLVEPSSSVRSGSLHSGQADLSTLIAPQDEPGLSKGGFRILSGIEGGVPVAMAANMTGSKILQDATVRQAIQLAINRKEIEESQSTDYGVANSILSPATIGFKNSSRELKQNVKKAKSILSADGWKVGQGGIRQKSGKPLNLTLLAFYEPNVYQLAQEELRAIGINLQLNMVSAAQYEQLLPTGNYDFAQAALVGQDPISLWTMFGDASVGGRNDAWFTSSTPDATQFNTIGAQLLQTTNQADRVKLAQQGQQILLKDNYAIPLSNIAQVFGVSDNVKGLKLFASRYLNLYNVSLGGSGNG